MKPYLPLLLIAVQACHCSLLHVHAQSVTSSAPKDTVLKETPRIVKPAAGTIAPPAEAAPLVERYTLTREAMEEAHFRETQKIGQRYLAEVEKLIKQATFSGRLKALELYETEKGRFQKQPYIPVGNLATNDFFLHQLQAQYHDIYIRNEGVQASSILRMAEQTDKKFQELAEDFAAKGLQEKATQMDQFRLQFMNAMVIQKSRDALEQYKIIEAKIMRRQDDPEAARKEDDERFGLPPPSYGTFGAWRSAVRFSLDSETGLAMEVGEFTPIPSTGTPFRGLHLVAYRHRTFLANRSFNTALEVERNGLSHMLSSLQRADMVFLAAHGDALQHLTQEHQQRLHEIGAVSQVAGVKGDYFFAMIGQKGQPAGNAVERVSPKAIVYPPPPKPTTLKSEPATPDTKSLDTPSEQP